MRLGRPKAWVRIGDEYFLQRAVRILQSVATPVVAAAREGQELPPLPEEVKVVRDVIDDAGPLSGMAAGFAALRESCEAAVVITCDHPLLKPEFLRRLVAMLGNHAGIVPEHDGQSYPLLAVYRLNTQSTLMETLLEGAPPGTAHPSRERKRPVEGSRTGAGGSDGPRAGGAEEPRARAWGSDCDGDAPGARAWGSEAPRAGAWGSDGRHAGAGGSDGSRAGSSECWGPNEHGRQAEPGLSVRGFAARCGAREVAAEELRDVDPNLESLLNVNDRETYRRLVGDR